jgi:glycosyltransferase involved in cell wall biosynthesis
MPVADRMKWSLLDWIDRRRAPGAGGEPGREAGHVSPALRPLMSQHELWLWSERPDLGRAFDVKQESEQAKFLEWFWAHGRKEYAAPDSALAWDHLAQPFLLEDLPFSRAVSVAMRKTWVQRPDLQAAFDLATPGGRARYADWFYRWGMFQQGLDATPYLDHAAAELAGPASAAECALPVNRFAAILLEVYPFIFQKAAADGPGGLSAAAPTLMARHTPEFLLLYDRLPDGLYPANPTYSVHHAASSTTVAKPKGANMIGYAHGAFGMGEHVKMSARALATQTQRFAIVDVDTYNHQRQPEADIVAWAARAPRYGCNIFHINADAMAGATMTVGPAIVRRAFNIGYWAWELAKTPEAWRGSIDFVDEIWAPSRFIQEAFQSATAKPVIFMPLCVELPDDRNWATRDELGLPKDEFLFLYYFDSHSYYRRKNPYAALRAFKMAFPHRRDVGLVIKTQHADEDSETWRNLLQLAEDDARIRIVNKTMSRHEVLSLQAACDCFVSLHRSEGFGRGPAEAMLMGKPVIVTAYSGNMDFTREGAALLVDYRLIPVEQGDYPFFEGQVWADPHEGHAAAQMRRLVDEPGLASGIGASGRALIEAELNFEAVGRRYADRLRELALL